MSTIKLAWKHDGQADSFNIYKSTLPMSLANMPEPAYTGITEKIFIDESIIDGVGIHPKRFCKLKYPDCKYPKRSA